MHGLLAKDPHPGNVLRNAWEGRRLAGTPRRRFPCLRSPLLSDRYLIPNGIRAVDIEHCNADHSVRRQRRGRAGCAIGTVLFVLVLCLLCCGESRTITPVNLRSRRQPYVTGPSGPVTLRRRSALRSAVELLLQLARG